MAARTAVLFLLLATVTVVRCAAPARSLLQSGVTCAKDIPACSPRRCTTRILASKEQYVCLRCMATFQPVRGSDGKSIVQCICPPGTKMEVNPATNTRSCVPCSPGFYCPGGIPKATPPTDAEIGGAEISCNPQGHSGLTTKFARASKRTDCVALGGYILPANPTEAARQCPADTYAPEGNRLRYCMPCPSGFKSPTAGPYDRSNRIEACQVPPGHFLELNVIRPCPVGLYRSNYVKVDDKAAISCLSCPPGYSTQGIASTSVAACTKVLAGFGLWPSGTKPEDILLQETDNATTNGLFFARCDYGYYSDGSLEACVRCPYGSTTRAQGSMSPSDCLVPPGYYVKTLDADAKTYKMTRCPVNVDGMGYYRDGWVSPTQVIDTDGTKACTACGKNILSAYVERDEIEDTDTLKETEGENVGFVAATSASCYILYGWGISFDPADFTKFKAQACPVNMYGVDKERAYGLINAPCKACAKNLVAPSGSHRFENCTNPAGFGYTSEGANQCPPDFYTAAESMSPCEPCPPGRTTGYEPGNGALQDSILDCKVPTGFGVFSADEQDPWTPANPSANMVVKKCPLGYYGVSDSPIGEPTSNPKCQKCPLNQGTSDEGLIRCDVCAPGYGIPELETSTNPEKCQPCPVGTYHAGGQLSCTKCPTTTFNHIHVGDTYVSRGMTFTNGLTGPETCVPKYAQLPQPAGARFALDPSVFENTPNLPMKECIEGCPANKCCMVQWEQTGSLCRRAVLPILPNPAGSVGQLYYKLPPSELISAASVKNGSDAVVRAKTQPAGIYTRCQMTDNWVQLAAQGLIGTSTNPDRVDLTDPATAVEWGDCSDEKSCRTKCESDSACWGFIFHPTLGWTTRGGEDQLGVRSFMSSPDASVPAGPEEGDGDGDGPPQPQTCPAGHGGYPQCTKCVGNTYNDGSQLLCQSCGLDQVAASEEGSDLLTKCVAKPLEKCPAGEGYPIGCGSSCSCQPCPKNTFSIGQGTKCQPCEADMITDGVGATTCTTPPPPPCSPGLGGWPKCDVVCVSRNMYNNRNFEQCQSCGAGKRPNRDGNDCVDVIKECPKGQGLVGAPEAYDSECRACSGLNFNPGGLLRCSECKAEERDVDIDGKAVSKVPNAARDKCIYDKSCPVGFGNPANDCLDRCLDSDMYNDGKSLNCQPCPSGTVTSDGKQCRKPRVCPAGFGGHSCNQKCDPSEYQDGTEMFCKECPAGQRPNSARSGCVQDSDSGADRSCVRRKPQVSLQCPETFAEHVGNLQSLPPRCVATSASTQTCPQPLVRAGSISGMAVCQCPGAENGEVPKIRNGVLGCFSEAVFLPDVGVDTDSPAITRTSTLGIWYDLIPSTKKCQGAQDCWDMCFFCDGRPRYHNLFPAAIATTSLSRPITAKLDGDSCNGSGKNCDYVKDKGNVEYTEMPVGTRYADFCNRWGVDAMHFSKEEKVQRVAAQYNAVRDPETNKNSNIFFDDDGAVIWPLRPKKSNNPNAVLLYGVKGNWPFTKSNDNNDFFEDVSDEIEHSLLQFGV